ncbi:MAG TPA: hypothetical protein VFU48_12740 [Nitrospira sp.]|nr:hypothetical protein [Nitrospira sp.]
MNKDVLQALQRLSKASKHAHQLRASLDKLLYLLPGAHDVWHKMAQETRHTEEYLEAMLEIIQEMLKRDPSSYIDIFLLPEESHSDTLPNAPQTIEM